MLRFYYYDGDWPWMRLCTQRSCDKLHVAALRVFYDSAGIKPFVFMQFVAVTDL